MLVSVVDTLEMSSYWTTHYASVESKCGLIKNILTLSNFGNCSQEKVPRVKKKKLPFISALPHIAVPNSHSVMRPNAPQHAVPLYQFLKDVSP